MQRLFEIIKELEIVFTNEYYEQIETSYIDKYNAVELGFNVAKNGKNRKGIPCSERTKKIISIANSGEKNKMFGKFSNEQIKDMLVKSLMMEYDYDYCLDMLEYSKIERHLDRIVVTYTNGVVDTFYGKPYVELVHSTKFKKEVKRLKKLKKETNEN